MKKPLLAAALLSLATSALWSQSISGTVVDQRGKTIPEAYIVHKASEHHAHSNSLGSFTLNGANLGDTLQIVHVGYELLEIVAETSPLTITLEEKILKLDNVLISPDGRILNRIANVDLSVNPVKNSQDLLQIVPGLFIGQHAGGGKAEQIFLRGFDIDHGTDIAITVDGMPVNMVSHSHGQGYSDLHFLIPETVQMIDFDKGPYYADKGNFATAGYVGFETKDEIDESLIKTEFGSFERFRTVALIDLLDGSSNQDAYLASEFLFTQGPFDAPQNFKRINVMGKYTVEAPGNSKLSLTGSHFTSNWDASGQIPVRAVEQGLISRFGAIDDTEGGYTSRTNLLVDYSKNLSELSQVEARAYYSRYDFELYSNFTFFLNDPVNGDQIRQREVRDLFGFDAAWQTLFTAGEFEGVLRAGGGLRYDDVRDNELSRTLNRDSTLSRIQFGDINELNAHAFVDAEIDFLKFTINPGLRLDYFQFNYRDELQTLYNNTTETAVRVTPNLNVLYNFNPQLQLFFKSGIGFHSNDSRLVISGVDIDDSLPLAYGMDLGFNWKPLPRLIIRPGVWFLNLDQEFVYVGDEGIVEPSGETSRRGVDLGIRYQFLDNWFFDIDATYTDARSTEEAEGEDYIPLAPVWTSTGGLSYQSRLLTVSIRGRYLADRPANEDNSIVAEGFVVFDANANLRLGKFSIFLNALNLLDVDWNETQFATESRLFNEPESVEEIHFTPGAPFALNAGIQFSF